MTAEVHAAVRAQLEALDGVVLDNTKARLVEAQRTIERLAAEKLVLLVEKEQLQVKFEASQLLADQAIKERDEFSDSRNHWNQAFCYADRELHLTRAELDETRGALERARDLAVRSGVFTRRDDAHSLADLPDWEDS